MVTEVYCCTELQQRTRQSGVTSVMESSVVASEKADSIVAGKFQHCCFVVTIRKSIDMGPLVDL